MSADGAHITEKSASVVMGRALAHPMRVRILWSMNAPIRMLSPSEFAEANQEKVASVGYHFRELAKAGCIRIAEEVPRRGATEHRYLPVKRALAWTREWDNLGSAVKQGLAATALRGAVEKIGEAVDQGTFESLPDSILAWDVMRVDEAGWAEAQGIMTRALEELLALSEECRERIGNSPGGDVFLVSYLLSTFESPEPQAAGDTD